MDIPSAQVEFAPTRTYLNSATVGLPPRGSVEAMTKAITDWTAGRVDPLVMDNWVDLCRISYAHLAGTTPDRVAITSQVSVVAGLVAASLDPGDRVLLAREDFTSVLFPFLEARARGVEVEVVPLAEVVGRIGPHTTLVAVSAVQSSDGRLIDLDALAGAAADNDALTFVDFTQAAGWLPFDADAFSITASGAYKWLCCPRGSGFMTIRPELHERVPALYAGWYAGEDRWSSVYGPPLRLAGSARRYDTSPAWLCWVGAAPALELLAEVGAESIHRHNLDLANRFRTGMGLEPGNSAIVSIEHPTAGGDLAAADVAVAERAGRTRLSFHLYNTVADVERALDIIGGPV